EHARPLASQLQDLIREHACVVFREGVTLPEAEAAVVVGDDVRHPERGAPNARLIAARLGLTRRQQESGRDEPCEERCLLGCFHVTSWKQNRYSGFKINA